MTEPIKTILIVEDEPMYQHSLAEKLEVEGFVVIGAPNGEAGLLLALEKHPDLILLDLQMPKMDGMEMIKKLRENEWGKNAKVIIITNLSDLGKVHQAEENGVTHYFIKTDITLEDLVEKVQELTR